MRLVSWFIPVVLLGACGGDDSTTPDAPPVDAYVPPWWQPMPGETKNWDVQLHAPFDLSAARVMYDVDLWALTPATTIDYGDGDPVTVPAGALAGMIDALHARTPRSVVICHVDTGAIRLGDPDARKFPGFEASPPDRPTPPKAGSVIGWSTTDVTERFLDLRPAARAMWSAAMWKRLDLAKQIGCDGVEPDRNDMVMSDPGFTIDITEQTSWYVEVAAQAHMRMLSAGMKGADQIPGQTDALADDFDWAMPERCAEFMGCDNLRPFINAHKAVFSIDYSTDIDGAPQTPSLLCSRLGLIQDGLVKDAALTSAFRQQCTP